MADDRLIPEEYICPLTMEIMKNPVIDREGVSYERDEILKWLQQGHRSSPCTGNNLQEDDLRPNLALKASIEKFNLALHSPDHSPSSVSTQSNNDVNREASQATVPKPPPIMKASKSSKSSKSETETHLKVTATSDGDSVYVQVTPLPGDQLTKSHICCVVDVSGSMTAEATIINESGAKEGFGLSVLDVTKHALNTIINTLSDDDRFSLVTFSNTAKLMLKPLRMTKANKTLAMKVVNDLKTFDLTNIWAGLSTGLDVMSSANEPGLNSAIFLLTDGVPNQSPGKGEVKTMISYGERNNGLPCQVYTFGFGYEMDSPMLKDLAIFGGGAYAFIPDSSFVGTVFVNAVSNHLVTAATDLQVSINAGKKVTFKHGDHELYKGKFTDNCIRINLGSIQLGQSKDFVIPVNTTGDPFVDVNVEYSSPGNKKRVSEVADCVWEGRNLEDVKYHTLRLFLVSTIQRALRSSGVEFMNRKIRVVDHEKGLNIIKSAIETMEQERNMDEKTKDLLADLTGQLSEAFSSAEILRKWGAHFCFSIMGAHLQQCCNNFKDPGVQNYGGKLFSDTRDRLDEVFIKLPPPKPSVKRTDEITGKQKVVHSMRPYMNACGGCFRGNGMVSMADGTFKSVYEIRKGAKVLTGKGTVDTVECVMKTIFKPDTYVDLACIDGHLWLTPYHPVNTSFNAINSAGNSVDTRSNEWAFPRNVGRMTALQTSSVYNLVLKKRGTVVLFDVECATLAHGLTGPVIGHDYFGTEAVVRDLKRLDGWKDGYVVVYPEWFRRSSPDNTINRISKNSSEWMPTRSASIINILKSQYKYYQSLIQKYNQEKNQKSNTGTSVSNIEMTSSSDSTVSQIPTK